MKNNRPQMRRASRSRYQICSVRFAGWELGEKERTKTTREVRGDGEYAWGDSHVSRMDTLGAYKVRKLTLSQKTAKR